MESVSLLLFGLIVNIVALGKLPFPSKILKTMSIWVSGFSLVGVHVPPTCCQDATDMHLSVTCPSQKSWKLADSDWSDMDSVGVSQNRGGFPFEITPKG